MFTNVNSAKDGTQCMLHWTITRQATWKRCPMVVLTVYLKQWNIIKEYLLKLLLYCPCCNMDYHCISVFLGLKDPRTRYDLLRPGVRSAVNLRQESEL